MDDYDYDYDYDDDGWLYAEDEFDLADELAENQIAEPGYSGTNFDIAMDSYEFELFGFWEDLNYGEDAYWDYGLSRKVDSPAGVKRKREAARKVGITDKRRKTQVNGEAYNRDDDPLLFVSREERTRSFFAPAPLLENPVKYTFLADWRERFANLDGVIEKKAMPVDMKRAAEAETLETPPKLRGGHADLEEGMEDDEEGDWEDDEGDEVGEEEEEEGDEPGLDPGMLEEILKQKLGDAGLGDENQEAFMQVIAKMMSGESDADDATGELANSLLGKLTSNTGGDSALSGWLSQQGVTLQDGEDDDASSVATVDLPESLRHTGLNTRQNAQDSPIDSVVGGEAQKKTSTQMPLHSASPSSSTKKRAATTVDGNAKPTKKQKKVTFDVPASSSSDLPVQHGSSDDANLPTSEDPLMSAPTLKRRPTPRASAATTIQEEEEADPSSTNEAAVKANSRTTRKRKAADADEELLQESKPPEKKRTRKKEVDMLEDAVIASPMGPPARRTRAAKAKAGK